MCISAFCRSPKKLISIQGYMAELFSYTKIVIALYTYFELVLYQLISLYLFLI